MGIKTMLHDEICEEIGELSKLQIGSDEYKVTVEGLSKLIDKTIEMDKIATESQDKAESLAIETQLKREQMEDDRKDKKIKNWLTGLGIVIPTAAAVWGTVKSIKFEETGSITTIMGRGWIQKLLPKK